MADDPRTTGSPTGGRGIPSPATPHYKTTPDPYNGPTGIDHGHGTYDTNAGNFQPPPVPSGSGNGGKTSVDTHPMEVFADNMDQLVGPIRQAMDRLHPVDIHAGAFYHANTIRTNLNGPNGDGGQKAKLAAVLDSLSEGVTDIARGTRELVAKYNQVHDASLVKATDLQTAMQSAQADFQGLAKATGSSAPPATNTTG